MSNQRRIQDLPDEILLAIFSYLDVEDLSLNIRYVCDKWSRVSQDSKLWKYLRYNPIERTTTEDRIIEVLKGAPNLRWPMPWFYSTWKILETISHYCKDVREIYINEADEKLVQKLVTECSNIECMQLDYYRFNTTNILKIVSQCNNLKHLQFSYRSYSDADIFTAIAQGCPSLESLDIQFLTHYSSSDLIFLLAMKGPQLRSLALQCCFYKEKTCIMPSISAFCTELEELTIDSHGTYDLFSVEHREVWGTSNFITYFQSSSVCKLKKLNLLSFDSFDNELAWTIFENCNNIVSLNLKNTFSLTDECLKPIYQLQHLTSLKCDYCVAITDIGISHIVKCKTLKMLSFMGCLTLTNRSFVMCCSELNMLESLVLNVPPLNIEDVFQVPHLLKNLNFLHISPVGLEERARVYFREFMPKMQLVFSPVS